MNGDSNNHSNQNHHHDVTKKQGGYGKIPIHSESKISQLLHFDEVFAAIRLLYITPLQSNVSSSYIQNTFDADHFAFCNKILMKVSRSFAAVIQQLPSVLLVDVTIFYLVLRALDTIEDDMNAFNNNNTIKIQYLQTFHEKLGNTEWCLNGVGEGDELLLLQQFHHVNVIYNQLPIKSQIIVKDITKRMGYGMATYVNGDFGQGTKNIHEYSKYCYYVAGLVGEGLSRLFISSSLENDTSLLVVQVPTTSTIMDDDVTSTKPIETQLSDNNSSTNNIDEQIQSSPAIRMGLFLQKTNIIRDFLEDYVDQRTFWPQEIWKKYSMNDEKTLGYFISDMNNDVVQYNALQCLNELINDALQLIPSVITYMNIISCYEIFRFCAIPQIMAIATLYECYNNSKVYTGVVKIRKGLSCTLILNTISHEQLYNTFHTFIIKIKNKAIIECNKYKDMNNVDTINKHIYDTTVYEQTIQLCNEISDLIKKSLSVTTGNNIDPIQPVNNIQSNSNYIIRKVVQSYPSFLLLGTAWIWDYVPPTKCITSTLTTVAFGNNHNNKRSHSIIPYKSDKNNNTISSIMIRIGLVVSAWYMYYGRGNNSTSGKLKKAEEIIQQKSKETIEI